VNILVLNVGSATLKFQVVATDGERIAGDQDAKLLRGQIERIGGESVITIRHADGSTRTRTASLRDMRAAVDWLVDHITSPESGTGLTARADIHAVGHRVVHGGEQFRSSVLVDDTVLQGIEDNVELAPLHNPHNLRGIEATRKALGTGVPQVAVFDTAFHHTLPEHAYIYAIPYPLYRRHRIRRYGFHGTSHRSIAYRFRKITGRERGEVRIVTLHLGNGCSACGIRDGVSIDTSMGFTPLEGLVMGTRSGDIDAALLDYIAAKEGLSLSQVEAMLNSQSGLLGISGLTNDMRDRPKRTNSMIVARDSRSTSSAIVPASTSAPISPRLAGQRRSCLPAVWARTVPRSVPASARGWNGRDCTWMAQPTRRWSTVVRGAFRPKTRRSTHGWYPPTRNC
jgi:acetate kinase